MRAQTAPAPTTAKKPTATSAAKPASKPAATTSTKPAAKNRAKSPAPGARTVSEKKPVESEQKIARRDPFESLVGRKQAQDALAKNLPPGKAGLQVSTLRLDGVVKSTNGMIAV